MHLTTSKEQPKDILNKIIPFLSLFRTNNTFSASLSVCNAFLSLCRTNNTLTASPPTFSRSTLQRLSLSLSHQHSTFSLHVWFRFGKKNFQSNFRTHDNGLGFI